MPAVAGVDAGAPAGPAAFHDAWVRALDDLEVDVAAAEELLRTAHLAPVAEVARAAVWQPPSALGPLPASLQVRGQALLDRQVDVARRTAQALVRSRRHLAATEALRPPSPDLPVYVDQQA
ncbi:hypothetical protein [Cellulomonas biazotea]|uniref:Uncharacterized protein n=1 Tax=Cellulomonas biazotea TaxID=1709 RepID=A0A402DW24_9CELL|nr:hypothetical protein [Cellulomonas biazotea]GCE78295.1 hypothetical protein CBZ_33510 [Cellulomonas biazotea]